MDVRGPEMASNVVFGCSTVVIFGDDGVLQERSTVDGSRCLRPSCAIVVNVGAVIRDGHRGQTERGRVPDAAAVVSTEFPLTVLFLTVSAPSWRRHQTAANGCRSP